MLKRKELDSKVADEKMRDIFEENTASVINFMDQKINFSYLICDYNQILLDPLRGIENMTRFLGLSDHLSEIIKIVNPNLYRHRKEQPIRNQPT